MKIKEILIWIGVIAVLIGGLWGLIALVNSSPSPSEPLKITGIPEVSKDDLTKGPENAKATLIEYGDFECPACAAYYPMVKQLSAEFSKDLRVVYRNFPLTNVHRNAMLAAQAAYAAGLQGQDKFWEMHDKLYENQSTWATSNSRELFLEYAKELNLDLEKFENDIDADATKQFVNSQKDSALSLALQSTPTFILNGNHIQNPGSYEEFKKLIQDEINKK